MTRVLVIGGYGNFGRFISTQLAKEDNIQLIIAGRNLNKAKALAEELNTTPPVETVQIDIDQDFFNALTRTKPDIVIHTSGPFQTQSYHVAEACITYGAHYIDLADGREFVTGIEALTEKAKQANVLIVSGASSVPCLTAALIDHYQNQFKLLESVDYGITTAQKTTRGLATTAAILTYTGKPFTTLIDGHQHAVYGWQNLHYHNYLGLGKRLLGNCDVPDLKLFPKRYPNIKTLRFYAGLELPFIHITLWGLSWLVRAGLIKSLRPVAPLLLKLSFLFDWLGSVNSGFHMLLSGKGDDNQHKTIAFELTARQGDGPFIPCMPAILLTKKLANAELNLTGAQACVDLINLNEYINALSALEIEWHETIN